MKIIQASNKCGQRSGKGAVLSPARCGFESVQLRFFKRHTQRFLTDNLTDDIIQKYNGKNVEWRFDKPYLFRAQNSTNRTGYGWGASNTQYGETTAYVISGAFLGFRNSGFTKIINEYYEQMHFSEYNIKNKSEEPSKIESLSHVPVLIDDTQKEKENMGKRYMSIPVMNKFEV